MTKLSTHMRRWGPGILVGAVTLVPMILLAYVILSGPNLPSRDSLPVAASGEFLGVDPDHYVYAEQAFAAYPQAFAAGDNQDNESKNARIWNITRMVELPGKPAGEDFGCGPQETGDCVSWGAARCISECLARQVALGKSVTGGVVFQPHQYGVARRNGDQKGYGKLPCNSSGAIPSLVALNFDAFGLVFYHEVMKDGIHYSGKLADQWGCSGVPEKWLKLGKTRSGGETYPIRTVEELRDAVCNSYPCTFAGPFTPGKHYTADRRNCLRWDGPMQGYHQMCVLGYDGSSGKRYFWIQNSHGPHGPNVSAATKPMQDEPLGGFWVSWDTMQSMLENKGESWAFSAVKGFEPQEIDWSGFEKLFQEGVRVKPQQNKEMNNEGRNTRAAVDRSRYLSL